MAPASVDAGRHQAQRRREPHRRALAATECPAPHGALSLEEYVAPHLASGALVRVLEEWCPPFAGFFLYYPSRRQQPAALSALIETLRL